jgi:hypothetical protein
MVRSAANAVSSNLKRALSRYLEKAAMRAVPSLSPTHGAWTLLQISSSKSRPAAGLKQIYAVVGGGQNISLAVVTLQMQRDPRELKFSRNGASRYFPLDIL